MRAKCGPHIRRLFTDTKPKGIIFLEGVLCTVSVYRCFSQSTLFFCTRKHPTYEKRAATGSSPFFERGKTSNPAQARPLSAA